MEQKTVEDPSGENASKRHYTPEFKAQTVELLKTGKSVSEVAEELCISNDLLYSLRRNAEYSQGGSAGARAAGEVSAANELRVLRRENNLLKQENDFLKKQPLSSAPKPKAAPGYDREIHRCTGHSIRRICLVLQVPRSSHYHAAALTSTQSADQRIGDAIEAVFKLYRRRYGYRRIWQDITDQGIQCAPARVRRIAQ